MRKLKPQYVGLPKWFLLGLVIVIGFPLHILACMYFSFFEGVQNWWDEVKEVIELD